MIKPSLKSLRGWRWILRMKSIFSGGKKQTPIPTLTLRNPRFKHHVDLYLSGNHCWYVWDDQGTGGENSATLIEGIRAIPISEAMAEAEVALLSFIRNQ